MFVNWTLSVLLLCTWPATSLWFVELVVVCSVFKTSVKVFGEHAFSEDIYFFLQLISWTLCGTSRSMCQPLSIFLPSSISVSLSLLLQHTPFVKCLHIRILSQWNNVQACLLISVWAVVTGETFVQIRFWVISSEISLAKWLLFHFESNLLVVFNKSESVSPVHTLIPSRLLCTPLLLGSASSIISSILGERDEGLERWRMERASPLPAAALYRSILLISLPALSTGSKD